MVSSYSVFLEQVLHIYLNPLPAPMVTSIRPRVVCLALRLRSRFDKAVLSNRDPSSYTNSVVAWQIAAVWPPLQR
jgi:hypothetical protein